MEKQEFINIVNKHLAGQGTQIDVAGVFPKLFLALAEWFDADEATINELKDLAETPHFVISFDKTSAELKEVYEACAANIILAKNIVFYNATDSLYYRVNGYNMVSNVLKLHTIMQGDSGLVDTVVNLSSNGTLSVG